MCSLDLDVQENLKSHFNDRLSNEIYNTLRELFSNININNVQEILPKINEYNRKIAMFIEDINAEYGIMLIYSNWRFQRLSIGWKLPKS